MSGRTTKKHVRIYINGKDMSGYTCSIPSLSTVFDEKICAALSDEIKNGLLGHAAISPNTVNAFLDNTSDGLHETLNDARAKRTVIVAVGDKTDPSAGVPAFAGQFEQLDYSVSGEDFVNATVKFGEWVGDAVTKDYNKSWGLLLHENIAETAANSNAGVDGYRQDETSKGGFLVYQVLSGDGTATISIEDSEDDSSFLALSGATTVEIDCSSVQYGLVALGTDATVRRYLRWQLSLNTATTVTFILAFIRL